MRRRTALKSIGATGFAWTAPVFAQRLRPHIAALRAFLQLPDGEIEFGKVKLAIDQMVDPRSQTDWATRQLDLIMRAVTNMMAQPHFGRRGSVAAKVDALRSYLHVPGPWNEGRVFRYDLINDPTGKNTLANKLIPNYLRTRLGNCVSMPVLFLILAQRLGVDATLSTAPEHLFVKYRDDSGAYQNLECTDGAGPKRDASYVRDFEISSKALDNRLYLQPLSKKQAIIQMACTLGDHYGDMGDATALDALANLMLEHQPNGLEGIQTKAAAYDCAIEVQFRKKYPRPEDVPAAEREMLTRLLREMRAWDERAKLLGWRTPSKEFEARYRRVVTGAQRTR